MCSASDRSFQLTSVYYIYHLTRNMGYQTDNRALNSFSSVLPVGTRLGNFRIRMSLGEGDLENTYLAEHYSAGEAVVLKEHYPQKCAVRDSRTGMVSASSPSQRQLYSWLLDRFLRETRVLSEISHPNVVPIKSAFVALGTAYYVMPYVKGRTLENLAPPPSEIDERWLRPVLEGIMSGLSALHERKVLHRRLSPSSILLKNEKTPVIIGFGSSRGKGMGSDGVQVTPYVAPEQVGSGMKRGPWTDVYALGGICYRLLTGRCPLSCIDRTDDRLDLYEPLSRDKSLRRRFSTAFLSAVDKALSVNPDERWQSIALWREALGADSRMVSGSPEGRRRGLSAWVVAAGVGVLLLGAGLTVGGVYWYNQEQKKELADATTQLVQDFVASHRGYSIPFYKDIIPFDKRLTAAPELARELENRAAQGDPMAMYVWSNVLCYGVGRPADMEEGMRLLRRAAELDNVHAQQALSFRLSRGEGCKLDFAESVAWCRKAAEKGLPIAYNNLCVSYLHGQGVPKDEALARRYLNRAVELGCARSLCWMGDLYLEGDGVPKDEARAVELYRRAADAGDDVALYMLGLCYEKGTGVEVDKAVAEDWYRRYAELLLAGAECGDPYYQYALGVLYQDGKSLGKDLNKAFEWFLKSARQNRREALVAVGKCYQYGHGTVKNLHEAFSCYKKAAEAGDMEGCYRLALCYQNSVGVQEDLNKAFEWFYAASERQHVEALISLAICYEGGKGTDKNADKAYACIVRAAESNVPKAHFLMGICYEHGIGTAANKGEAVFWYRKAARKGYEDAQKRLRELKEEW